MLCATWTAQRSWAPESPLSGLREQGGQVPAVISSHPYVVNYDSLSSCQIPILASVAVRRDTGHATAAIRRRIAVLVVPPAAVRVLLLVVMADLVPARQLAAVVPGPLCVVVLVPPREAVPARPPAAPRFVVAPAPGRLCAVPDRPSGTGLALLPRAASARGQGRLLGTVEMMTPRDAQPRPPPRRGRPRDLARLLPVTALPEKAFLLIRAITTATATHLPMIEASSRDTLRCALYCTVEIHQMISCS